MLTDIKRCTPMLAALFTISVTSGLACAQTCLEWSDQFALEDVDGPVYATAIFDDGSGPALYVGGTFETCSGGGIEANHIAKWDGSSWSAVGSGVVVGGATGVWDLEVFDDGSGPALYAAGTFSSMDGVACSGLARWDGTSWTAMDTGSGSTKRDLHVYDDGSGEALYVAGKFISVDGVPAFRVARWNGSFWSAVGSGVGNSNPNSSEVRALRDYDDGTGPALYAGGSFQVVDGQVVPYIARWNGTIWEQVGPGMTLSGASNVSALHVFDDGSGDALYIGGQFEQATSGGTARSVVAWDGTGWQLVGAGVDVHPNSWGEILQFATFDDGSSEALYAGGIFDFADGAAANNIAKFDGSAWEALGAGVDDDVTAMLAYEVSTITDLYVWGTFSEVDGKASPWMASWTGLEWVARGNGLPDSGATVTSLQAWDDGSGDALFVGGANIDFAGGTAVNNVAKWNGVEWSDVGGGLSPGVRCFELFDDGDGTDLYAGGIFEQSGTGLNRIARWDGATWTSLRQGLDGEVSDLAVFDDGGGESLYVVGEFRNISGLRAVRAATFNGTDWGALGDGVSATIRDWIVFDDGGGEAVYAVGDFLEADGLQALRVAKWDGTQWTQVGSGIPGSVHSIEVFDDGGGATLYVGGDFWLPDTGGAPIRGVAKWNGTDWEPLTSGIGAPGTYVSDLLAFDDGSGTALYATGTFQTAGSVTSWGIARWDGTNWSQVGTGTGMNTPTGTRLCAFDDGLSTLLIVGGNFSSINGTSCSRVAGWDGTNWAAFGSGFDNRVRALAVFDAGSGDALFAGGDFSSSGGQPAHRIARWNGTAWDDLGSSLIDGNDSVYDLCVFDDGSGDVLVPAGQFSSIAGLTTGNMARWDGSNWEALPASPARIQSVAALTAGGTETLYFGGLFFEVGLRAADRIARWDGSEWHPVGGGLNHTAYAAAVFDDGSGESLYVAGRFTEAGGTSVSRVARWDGSTWSDVGGGVDNSVYELLVHDDGSGSDLYAGGRFTMAGGSPALRIAKWDGASWGTLGGGVTGDVLGLGTFDDGDGADLYVGGSFLEAGGNSVNRIARWDGTAWSALDTGMNDSVRAFAAWNNSLFAGGSMTFAGSKSAGRVARWGTCPARYTPSCEADWNQDTLVNTGDFLAYLNDYNLARNGQAPIYGDPDIAFPFGSINTSDFLAFLNLYNSGCP